MEEQSPVGAVSVAPKPKDKKGKRIIVGLISFFATIAVGTIFGLVFEQKIIDFIYGLGYEPTAEMAEVMNNVGFTSKASLIVRSVRPSFEQSDDFNNLCPSDNEDTSTLGCYSSYENRIYIYDIEDGELDGVKESVLAHEVLHAIYDRIGITKIDKINQAIDSYYKEHEDLFGDYMKNYSEDMYYTELHSIIGQRVHYADLSPVLQEHYSQYFTDYDKMVGFYDQYHSKLDAIDKEIATASAEIDNMHNDIESRLATYEAELEQFNRDVNYHNSQANRGYWSQSRFDSLIQRQEKLEKDEKKLNEAIELYNNKVRSYNELLDSRSHLYGLLDSKYKKKTEESNSASSVKE